MNIRKKKENKISELSKEYSYYPAPITSRMQSTANSDVDPKSPRTDQEFPVEITGEEKKSDSQQKPIEDLKKEREEEAPAGKKKNQPTVNKEQQIATMLTIGLLMFCWALAGILKRKSEKSRSAISS